MKYPNKPRTRFALNILLVLSFSAFLTNLSFGQSLPSPSTPTPEVGTGTAREAKHPSYKELMAPPDPKATPWEKLKLTDSKGKNFTIENLQGKLLLINFFFAHCPDVCPPQTAALNKIMTDLPKPERDSVRFLSITIDPDNDTAPKLEEYKKQFGIKSDNWIFARMTKDQLEKLGTHFGSLSGDPKKPLDHKAKLFLINTNSKYLLSYASAPTVDVPRITRELGEAVRTFVKPKS